MTKNKQYSKRYKKETWGAKLIDFLIQTILGSLFFYLILIPFYNIDDDFFTMMSLIMLISLVSSGLAYVCSALILRALRRRGKGKSADSEMLLYNVVSILIKSALTAAGVLTIIYSTAPDVFMLIGYIILIKVVVGMISLVLASLIKRNAIAMMAVLIFFGVVLTISFFKIKELAENYRWETLFLPV